MRTKPAEPVLLRVVRWFLSRFASRSVHLLLGGLLVMAIAGHHRGRWCSAAPQGAPQVRQLSQGQTARGRLTESEDRFAIPLSGGLFLRISITVEAPVRVGLSDPDGRDLVDSLVGRDTEVPVSAITRHEGSFEFWIRAAETGGLGVGYRFEVSEARPVQPGDVRRTAADRLVLEASFPVARFEPAAAQGAVQDYEAALRSYQDLQDHEQAVQVLMQNGRLHLQMDEYGEAAEILEAAVRLCREIGDAGLEAAALNAVSSVYSVQGKVKNAVTASEDALKLARETGDRWLEARALLNRGVALNQQAPVIEATDSLLQALVLWRDLDWKPGEAEALYELGRHFIDSARDSEAGDPLTRALNLWRELGDGLHAAKALQVLGILHLRLDEKQEALDFCHQAQQLLPSGAAERQRASLFSTFGWIYFYLGDMGAADDYFGRALAIALSHDFTPQQGLYLHQLGLVSVENKDYAGARKYYEAALPKFRDAGDQKMVTVLVLEIARLDLTEGNPDSALDLLDGALGEARANTGPYVQAQYLDAIGQVHHERENHDLAYLAYTEALSLLEAGNYRYLEARTRFRLARLERDRGNLEEARQQSRSAIDVIESVRLDIPGSEMRASYFSSTHDYFEFYIDLLMRLDAERPGEAFDAEAFQQSERSRSRSLLDSLAEANVGIREGVDAGLLAEETDLKRRMNAAAERQAGLSGDDKDELEAVAREIQDLTTEYERVQALIRNGSPKYAALTQPEPLTLGELQREVLDEDTVLLEYALGDERSYLWAVSADAYETYELPARAEIEESVRRLRDLLTAHEARPGEPVRELRLRIREADARYWGEAAKLSGILLGPVAAMIEKRRLLIVSDGALQYLPFAVLPVPDWLPGENPIPMVVEHELVQLPSASTLAVLRNETAGREKAERSLAVLADPVFEADDIRITRQSANLGSRTPQSPDSATPETNAVGSSYARLPSTRQEAEAIVDLAPDGLAKIALGFEANRELAVSQDLERYQIVHFATHSTLHEHPELSKVVLSMFNEQGRRQDGELRLHDIYNLRLPAELVVLSACNSSLGKQVRGEGLVGLVRGFMYAGASRVIASLWKVDDAATKELMVRFYRNLFRDGESPAAALRNAQVEMWQQTDWRSPYYWAAFVLQGEWR